MCVTHKKPGQKNRNLRQAKFSRRVGSQTNPTGREKSRNCQPCACTSSSTVTNHNVTSGNNMQRHMTLRPWLSTASWRESSPIITKGFLLGEPAQPETTSENSRSKMYEHKRDVTVLARRVVSAARTPTRRAAGAPTVDAPGGRPASTPAGLQTTMTDDDKRQPAKQYWPIRRASNNNIINRYQLQREHCQ